MLNGNDWQHLHGDFLSATPHLMSRTDECLSHLELINDDKDAIECLLATLHQIAGMADTARVESVAGFARQLRYLLYFASAAGRLQPKALVCLRECLSLLSWQIELIDPLTGLLPLDDVEQHQLLEAFGCCCGIGTVEGSHCATVGWPLPLAVAPPETAPGERADRSNTV
jgi:chemotaxis protein histidine kinase CheA